MALTVRDLEPPICVACGSLAMGLVRCTDQGDRYPSREAFSQMVADPEYQQVTHLRTEAVLQATVPRETPTVG